MGTRLAKDSAVVVCGLGRFGSAAAEGLSRLGHDVLAIDRNAGLVQEWAPKVARAVEADTTNPETLAQLGCSTFPLAIVGIGTSVESSVLTCSNLVDIGLNQIWAKAITPAHGRILSRIGVHKVIYPEADAGTRVAHLATGRLLDYIDFGDGYAIAKMLPPKETQGFTLEEAGIRKKYGVTVIGLKSPGKDFQNAVPSTRISAHDVLVVTGHSDLLDKFASRP